MATWTNESKNSSTFVNYLRRGKEPTMGELADYTFEDIVTQDGKKVKELTFDELSDQVWTNQSKEA